MAEESIVSPSEEQRPSGGRPAAKVGPDLSREIEQTLDRQPGDQVRCTRVGTDRYRCNWWCVSGAGGYDNPAMKGGQLATDHRIRKSAFLRVTKGRKGLSIAELT